MYHVRREWCQPETEGMLAPGHLQGHLECAVRGTTVTALAFQHLKIGRGRIIAPSVFRLGAGIAGLVYGNSSINHRKKNS